MVGSFRIHSKSVFLTYPRCNLEKEELMTYIKTLGETTYVLVARELHESGDPHLHVLIEWVKKRDIKDERYFDYKEYHPNIQSTKCKEASKTYIQKDGDFIESVTEGFDCYKLAKTMPYETFMGECLKRKIPYMYAADAVKRKCDKHTIMGYEAEGTISFSIEHDWSSRTNICIYGRAGTGKTEWAKKFSPKPALWITHIDGLKKFDPALHQSIIFDDISFSHIPITGQIALVDYDNARDIHIRYGVVTIPEKIPKIFCCNDKPLSDHEAINRRVKFHHIN